MGFNDYIIKNCDVAEEQEERKIDISCYDPKAIKKAERKKVTFDWDTWVPRIFWAIMSGAAIVRLISAIIELKKETKE